VKERAAGHTCYIGGATVKVLVPICSYLQHTRAALLMGCRHPSPKPTAPHATRAHTPVPGRAKRGVLSTIDSGSESGARPPFRTLGQRPPFHPHFVRILNFQLTLPHVQGASCSLQPRPAQQLGYPNRASWSLRVRARACQSEALGAFFFTGRGRVFCLHLCDLSSWARACRISGSDEP
jgi:hypothetical protein